MKHLLLVISLVFCSCCHKAPDPPPKTFSTERALLCTAQVSWAQGLAGGSGVVILNRPGRPLTILTASHVVRRTVDYVASVNNTAPRPVVVMRKNPKKDIAIVQGMPPKKHGCEAVLAPELMQGERVFSTGHPPMEQPQVLDGIVSAVVTKLGRRMSLTNAMIRKGWSGGPLWNSRGELAGIAQLGNKISTLSLMLHRDEIAKFLAKGN